ncbi:MAG: twin-arginine translocase subunit TatC [Planctomycetota bacterium]|jgi:sec-independent protein translocase protein TatC
MSSDTMPLLDHLAELRRRIQYTLLFLLCGTVIGYLLYPRLIEHILALLGPSTDEVQLLGLAEGFLTRIRYAIILGLFLTTPLALWQTCAFAFPGLTRTEKRWVGGGLVAGLVLFLGGMAYGSQTVLPVCLTLFQEPAFQPEGTVTQLHFAPTLDLLLRLFLAFGIVFELPLALFLLMGVGVLRRQTLLNLGRYAIVLAFVIAALLTPPDPFSQVMVAIPLIGLFYLAIGLARLFGLGGEQEGGEPCSG